MKRVILFIFLLIPGFIWAQKYSINRTGDPNAILEADDPLTWNPISPEFCQANSFIISSGTTVRWDNCNNWSMKWNRVITIESGGKMILDKNAAIGGGSRKITVESGGALEVGQNFTVDGGLILKEGSSLTVGGNYISSNLGNLTVEGTGVVISVGGDLSLNNSNLNGISLGQGTMQVVGNMSVSNNSQIVVGAVGVGSGNITVGGNVSVGSVDRDAIILTEGSEMTVGGNYTSSNGTIALELSSTLDVEGQIVVSGSVRDAIDASDSYIEAARVELQGSARIQLDNSEFQILGDLVQNAGGGLFIAINNSIIDVDGALLIPNSGDIVIDNSTLTVDGGAIISNGGASLDILSGAEATINGDVDFFGEELNVDAGSLFVNGNLFIHEGGRIMKVDNGGLVEVTGGNVNVFNSGQLDLISGIFRVYSIEDSENPGSFIGGNMYVYNSGIVVVHEDGTLSVLGNRDLPGATSSPAGDLIITTNGSVEIIVNYPTYGKVLVFNDVPIPSDGGSFFTDYAGTDLNPDDYLVIMGGETCDSFDGPGGIGANCNQGDASLPIELLSFDASVLNDAVQLTWKTATEIDNDFFTLYRSYNGADYEFISTVDGRGTTDTQEDYDYADHAALPGVVYYQLSQTDYDGTTEVFKPISVNFMATETAMTLYPNPVKDQILNLRIVGLEADESAVVNVSDLAGRSVYYNQVDISRGGAAIIELDISSRLVKGTYIVSVAQNGISFKEKLIKM